MTRPSTQQTTKTQNRLKKLSWMYPLPARSRPSIPARSASRSRRSRATRSRWRSWRSVGSTVTDSASRMTSWTASGTSPAPTPCSMRRRRTWTSVVAMSACDHRAALRRRFLSRDLPKTMRAIPLPRDTAVERAVRITGRVGSVPMEMRSGFAWSAHHTMAQNNATMGTVTMPSAMHRTPYTLRTSGTRSCSAGARSPCRPSDARAPDGSVRSDRSRSSSCGVCCSVAMRGSSIGAGRIDWP